MPASVMTYTSLYDDIQKYAERTDVAFTDKIPTFIMLAENNIAAEAKGLGFLVSATGTLTPGQSGSAVAKPVRWRETVSFTIGTGTPPNTTTAPLNYRVPLKLRSYEYCRRYAPDASVLDTPVYYSDWDWGHYLIAPSPDIAYPFELIYFERPQPLDSANTTNWTTQYAPQLLLFACLLEASGFVKNKGLVDNWQARYDRALKQIEFESKSRIVDRSEANPK